MSRNRPTEVQAQELTYPCQYCGAEPGMWCLTKSGTPYGYLHADRWHSWWGDHHADGYPPTGTTA